MRTLRQSHNLFQLAGKAFVYVGPTVSVAVFAGLLLLGEVRLATLSLYIVLPVVTSTAIFSRWDRTVSQAAGYRLDRTRYRMLSVVFWLDITALLFKTYAEGPRDAVFFALLALAGIILFVQILYAKLTKTVVYDILFRQVVLLLLASWSLSLNYQYYTGGTDVLVHVWLVEQFLGGVPPADWESIYSSFPLWHLFVGAIKELLGPNIEVHTVAFVFGGLSFLPVPLLVYATANRLFGSIRAALASSLFVVFNSYVIYYGAYSIPRGTVLVFFVAVVYLLYRSQSRRLLALLVLLSASIVVFHPSSPPFILPILALALVQKYVSVSRDSLGQATLYLVLFGVGVVAYWLFYSEVLITAIVTTLFLVPTSGAVPSGISNLGITVQTYLEYVPYTVLLLFIFTTFLGTVLRDESDRRKQFVLVAVVVALISFPNPLTLIERVQQLNFERWGIYAPAFISVAAGVGIVRLKGKGRVLHYCVLLLFVVFSLTLILNPQISADSSDFNHDVQAPYLDSQDIAAIEYATEFSDGRILSDYIAYRYIENSPYSEKASILIWNQTTGEVYQGQESNLILFRQGDAVRKVLKFQPGNEYMYKPNSAGILPVTRENVNISRGASRIYDNGDTVQYA